jgi:hypothetical protein
VVSFFAKNFFGNRNEPAALRGENSHFNLIMKNRTLNRLITVAAVAVVAFGALSPIEAQARGRSKTVHGARGGSYQRQVNHMPGHLTASKSATLPNGKTASRSLSTQKTDTGRSTSAQAIGFNGKSATYESTRSRTENGYTRHATAVGPNGATASKQVNVSSQDGNVSRTVTTTKTPPKP